MGSNIDPEANLRAAAALLKEMWPAIRFSSVWQSKAREVVDQPDFLNAVCVFETDESSDGIAEKLQAIERTLKKNPPFRYGPRTIDLDLLLVGNCILPSEKERQEFSIFNFQFSIILPHPKLHERRFVLEPLIELVGGNFLHPVLRRLLKDFLEKVKDQECRKVKVKLP